MSYFSAATTSDAAWMTQYCEGSTPCRDVQYAAMLTSQWLLIDHYVAGTWSDTMFASITTIGE